MRNKKIKITVFILCAVAAAALAVKLMPGGTEEAAMTEVRPARGAIQSVISTTGTVLPKNRLEVKPPVNGRIEEILVCEGDRVKAGQNLCWMSSAERAAIIDAARGKEQKEIAYWQDVYKPISLVSPIDGEVIVAKTQPGQTVTTNDAVIVLSDHLIVRAEVDETDIGKIRKTLQALISLDAYPDKKVPGMVEHIYYESRNVNNVIIYEVDVLPRDVPSFFRSGMSATLEFKAESRENAILLPQPAIHLQGKEAWVMVKEGGKAAGVKRNVTVGISDEKNTEIISGLSEKDIVLVPANKYILPVKPTAKNPFMPQVRRGGSGRSSR
jgi:macrolide-specific efflux system membrane fusion protein